MFVLLLAVLAVIFVQVCAQDALLYSAADSPLKTQLEYLYDLGCTNKIVAHYVIDIAKNPPNNDGKTVLLNRLAGIYDIPAGQQNSIDTWIDGVKTIL